MSENKESWREQLEEILVENDVWVWVVWCHEYYDDYKNGYSYSRPIECCYNKYEAYRTAMEYNLKYIKVNCSLEAFDKISKIESHEEQLKFIEYNFDEIYGAPEFTCEPCHTIWKVIELPIAI